MSVSSRAMSAPQPVRPGPRAAEAHRNRQRLVEVATELFASGEGPASLDAIARGAGVGIGTLYRHFKTREALVEAVYEDQMGRLRAGAEELLAVHPPAQALRCWSGSLLDWVAVKHGMADVLRAVLTAGRGEQSETRAQLVSVVALFLTAGAAAGDLRGDVDAADVAALLAGVMAVAGAPDQRERATRMIDVIIEGLRVPPAG